VRHSVDTLAVEEPTQSGGDGTVLTATLDDPNDVIGWNYTSQSSVLVIRACGRHSNRCRRGLVADVHYATVGKSITLNFDNLMVIRCLELGRTQYASKPTL